MPATDQELLGAACCIVGLDGEICRPDSSLLHRLANRAGYNGSLPDVLQRASEDHDFYQAQLGVLIQEPERAIGAVLRIAAAEGALHDTDRISVRHLADRLGLDPARTEEVLRKVRIELGFDP